MTDASRATETEALVLAGHGSRRHPHSAAPVYAHADRIRESGRFDEVRAAFWKESPALQDVASCVRSDVAYVVPVLTSEGYFAREVFPRELGVEDPPANSRTRLRYADPVGTHPALTDVVVDRVESRRRGPPVEVGVVLVGHGTERTDRSSHATTARADALRDRRRYAEVHALFLDEPPYVEAAFEHVTTDEVVVVPLFVADGHHTTSDVPAALGHPGVGESAVVDGRLVHYTRAVGSEPDLADVIVERAVEAGATAAPDRSAARPTDAESAFLARVGAADRLRWGELSVSRGDRGYDVRHHADEGVSRAALEAVDGPTALQDCVWYDDDGRYRPHTGAETLPTGWVLAGLGDRALVHSVRNVYPGSIAIWFRSERGDLAVSDLRETIGRQTGLYRDLVDLDVEARSAVTEAVCGGCVRRRRWAVEPGSELATDEADGGIPCREACPFLLATAHAVHESGGAAAAEPDPTVPAGTLADPANEYRVRTARSLARGGPAASSPGLTGGED